MDIRDNLRGGLVVSCQPIDGGPMDRPDIVSGMAEAAANGGAVGIRIEGVENLRAARPHLDLPVIGLVKEDAPGTGVRITPRLAHVKSLAEAGADIIAYDGTSRPRQDDRDAILAEILKSGKLAMADCATEDDGRAALSGGAAIIGTTLSGYTAETETGEEGPDLALVRAFANLGGFVMAEGRYNTPALAAGALAAGADSVTVGSALTRLELMTAAFRDALLHEKRK